MTTPDPFTEAARAEAEERPTIALARFIAAWDQGVETTDRISHWAVNLAMALRDHLAAQEPTDAEVEAVQKCLYERTLTWVPTVEARAALSAASAARRDEEKR